MKITKILVTLFFTIVIIGCSGLQTNNDSEPAWKYGNFCGKDHPRIDSRLPVPVQITQLSRIHPVDDIDLACFWHDVCYTVEGKATATCDHILSSNLEAIRKYLPKASVDRTGLFKDEDGFILDGCTKLVNEVSSFAIAASGWNSDDIADKIITTTVMTIATVVNTPAMLIGGAFSYQGGSQAVGTTGVTCISKRRVKFIAPTLSNEISNLRSCYDLARKFSRCRNVPYKNRRGDRV